MDKNQELDVYKSINSILSMKREENLCLLYYSIKSYLYSTISFGINNDISKDCINVIKEYYAISEKERNLLLKLKDNLNLFDYSEINEYLNNLDDLDELTIKYYYKVLEDIEIACDMKEPRRAKRIKKNFKFLTETDEYDYI